MSKQVLFEEKQQFRQPSEWIILSGLSLFFTYGLIKQVFFGIDFGTTPIPDIVLILIWLIFAVGFPLAIWKATLITRVYSESIGITFFPLKLNEEIIGFDQIFKVEATTYHPVLEYGGYGIKTSAKGKVYNVHGKKGVKLWLKSNRPILIGSQHSDELCRILRIKIE